MLDILAHLVSYAARNCPAFRPDSVPYTALAVAIWIPWFVQIGFLALAYFRREALFWLIGLWSTAASLLAYGLVALLDYNDAPAGGCVAGPSFPSANAQYMGLVTGVAVLYWYRWACTPTATAAIALALSNAAFAAARIALRYDSMQSLVAGYLLGLAEAVFWMDILRRNRRHVERLRKSWIGAWLGLYDTLCIAHGEIDPNADPAAYASPPASDPHAPRPPWRF